MIVIAVNSSKNLTQYIQLISKLAYLFTLLFMISNSPKATKSSSGYQVNCI